MGKKKNIDFQGTNENNTISNVIKNESKMKMIITAWPLGINFSIESVFFFSFVQLDHGSSSMKYLHVVYAAPASILPFSRF